MCALPRRAVSLLEADPELAEGLPPDERDLALRHLRVPVTTIEPGRWRPDATTDWTGHLGLLVIEGVLARDVSIRRRCCAELVGAGDLIRPWDEADDALLSVDHTAQWEVIEPASVAIIDPRATALTGRWPALLENIVARSVRRARMSALQLALTQVAGVDVRVHLMLWHLADRWGKVTTDGVVLPVRLTHELVGKLIGAQRQSVTSALRRLGDDGLVWRLDDGGWLLRGSPDEVNLEHAPKRTAGPVSVAA
jgi:CRP/FNR family transcriptional regulator, cyclic AMP receptor protein